MSILKNAKVSAKLIFMVLPAILALLALLVYFVYQLNDVSVQSKKALYDEVYVSTAQIINADRDFYQAAIAENELVWNEYLTAAQKETLVADFNENAAQVEERMNGAIENIRINSALYGKFEHSTAGVTLEELDLSFQSDFERWKTTYDTAAGTGDYYAHLAAFDDAREEINLMTELLEEYANHSAEQIRVDVAHSIKVSAIGILAVVLFVLALAVFIIIYLRGNIRYITGISTRISEGELSMTVDPSRISKDELGQLCGATGKILGRLSNYVAYIEEITQVLGTMASGDMRISLKHDYVGEFASIKTALLGISSSMNETLSKISVSAEQVNSGAEQVSSTAQSLAQGATEQASTIEQLSASINEVAEKVRQNADNVEAATDYVAQSVQGVNRSNEQMHQMVAAMKEISASSTEIAKIIKVIDDIAFQTNILALNAAVEAARAGAAGKGFAVVADEVRNLASKSAEAAKQTAELIEGSIKSVASGTGIADLTAQTLAEVETKARMVEDSIQMIDKASKEQSAAITQITQGVEQISAVVQTNSATAEESAAAAQEMTGQAAMLHEEVARFKLDQADQADHAGEKLDFALTPAPSRPGKPKTIELDTPVIPSSPSTSSLSTGRDSDKY